MVVIFGERFNCVIIILCFRFQDLAYSACHPPENEIRGRPDFTSDLLHGLAIGRSKFYIALYAKIIMAVFI